MQPREPRTILIAGAKKHGKSTLSAELVLQMQWPNALIYKSPVNINDKAFSKFKVSSFYTYTGGKVIVDASEIRYKEFVKRVNKHFRNGAVLVDDSILYEKNVLTDEMLELVAVNRRMFMDVIFVYHSLRQVPLDLFDYVTDIILFHTTGNFKYKATKLPDIGEELMQAQKEIKEIVAQCRCGDPCKCGKRYTWRHFKTA